MRPGRLNWLLLLLPLAWTARAQHYDYQCLDDQRNDFTGTYTTLTQGAAGKLWLGTDQGVWTYDGAATTAFDFGELPGTEEVSTIAEDRDGRAWLGFRTGQIIHGFPPDNWTAWDIEEGLPQARITAIRQDAAGDRWIGTYGEGVYCYRAGRLYQFGEDDGLPSSDVYDLTIDSAGVVWVATDAGVCLLAWRDDAKWIRTFSTQDGLPDNIVTTLHAAAGGGCWLGTYEGGVVRCDYRGERFTARTLTAWPGGRVTGLARVDAHQLWVGTAENGVYVYPLDRDDAPPLAGALSDPPQRIQSLLFDREGLLWILSHDRGLCRVQPRLLSLPLDNLPAQALTIGPDNRLWVGGRDGLYYQAATGRALRPFPLRTPLNIISLYVDKRGRLWLGTFGEGMYRLDPVTGELLAIGPEQGLTNGSILSIAGDEEGMWLATLGGVFHGPAGEDLPRFTQPENTQAIGTDFLYTCYLDRSGTAWFGTDGHGLSASAPDGTLRTYRQAKDGRAIRSVFAITEDGQGRIWFSTDDQRIYYQEGDGFVAADIPRTFGRNEVVSLGTDPLGNVLIIHQAGLTVYEVGTQAAVDYALSERSDFTPILNAGAVDRTGRVWLAGDERLLVYVPFTRTYRHRPQLSLEAVSVYLTPLDFRNVHVLEAGQNNLIFKYRGVWLSHPDEVRYRYRLRGFDQNWIETRDQQAVYSNLPPGKYEFVVTAARGDRFGEEEGEATYAFDIRPPVYLQTWFVVSCGLVLLLLSGYVLRRRERRLQKEALLLKEKVESQYETLKSQINPHFLFNSFNTLVTLIEEHPSFAVTYVEKLADFYRSILQYRERDVVELETELQVVRDYHFLLTQRYQDNLQLVIDELPVGKCVPPLAVQMLLENAVKHNVISQRRPLRIRVYGRADYLVVENAIQPKFTSEPSTGFGLQNIRNRYALLTNSPVLVEGDERIFRIALPLLNNQNL